MLLRTASGEVSGLPRATSHHADRRHRRHYVFAIDRRLLRFGYLD
jgi:hypothetical protein